MNDRVNKYGLNQENVTAWVEKNFPDHKQRRDGQELVICNPFDGDTGFNFNISTTRFTCHDWRGDSWQGRDKDGKDNKRTFLNFVRQYLRCTWSEACKSVTGTPTFNFRSFKREDAFPQPSDHNIELPIGSTPLWNSPHPIQSGILLRWLASRGVAEEDVQRYQIHYVASEVVWPYYEWETLVYWQSRSRMDKKFRFPPSSVGVGKGDFLYGFDDVEPASHLVITEAIFDKLTLRDQAVASGGAVLTERQLAKVRAIGPRDGIILAPDNDAAGVASLVSNGRMLMDRGYRVFYSLPPELPYTQDGEERTTKDWNELGKHVVGWDGVPALMEKGIKLLNRQSLVRLQLESSKVK